MRGVKTDGDSHGPKGRELLEDLVADSPQKDERALRAACHSIKARIERRCCGPGKTTRAQSAGFW
jgi:hypothetical protein